MVTDSVHCWTASRPGALHPRAAEAAGRGRAVPRPDHRARRYVTRTPSLHTSGLCCPDHLCNNGPVGQAAATGWTVSRGRWRATPRSKPRSARWARTTRGRRGRRRSCAAQACRPGRLRIVRAHARSNVHAVGCLADEVLLARLSQTAPTRTPPARAAGAGCSFRTWAGISPRRSRGTSSAALPGAWTMIRTASSARSGPIPGISS